MNISKFIAARFDAEQALKLYAKTPTNLQRRAQTQLLGSLAAFVRDITDETPIDREWLERVAPRDKYTGQQIRIGLFNSCYFMRVDETDPDEGNKEERVELGIGVTRGRVRLLALAMGLELREEVD